MAILRPWLRGSRGACPWPGARWGTPADEGLTDLGDQDALWLDGASLVARWQAEAGVASGAGAGEPDPVDLGRVLPEPSVVGARWVIYGQHVEPAHWWSRWVGSRPSTPPLPRAVVGSALFQRGYVALGGVTDAGWEFVFGRGIVER